MEFNSHTDKTESCSLKERDTKLQEKQSPISSKGKYDMRPSTLVPRDYGEEEEEESAEKKKIEAVIDLTEDDEVGVETKESKPVETKAGLPSKDDSVPLPPHASSLRKNYESPTTPSPATSPMNDTPSPIRKAVLKVDSHLVGYPAGHPAKSPHVLKNAIPKAKNVPKAAPVERNLPSEPPRPEPSGSPSISVSCSSKHVS